jgi:putative membrane protein
MRTHRLVTLGATLILCGSAASASAKSDKAFLKDAIQGNLGEVSLGQLAQKNGNSEGVRSFGQMLVQDHSASNQKATALAKKEGVTPPTEPKPEAKAEQDKLSKLSGDAFDKEFVNYMVKDHQKDIEEFEKQAKGSDEVASFAKDTLPTLQKHLQTAQSLGGGKSAQK